MTETDDIKLLDTRGLLCPEPLMLLHGKVREVGSGERIKVIATDPSTQRDIPKFCTYLGHKLESQDVVDGVYYYVIVRA